MEFKQTIGTLAQIIFEGILPLKVILSTFYINLQSNVTAAGIPRHEGDEAVPVGHRVGGVGGGQDRVH